MNPIRIVLADDHPVVRVGLRSLLEKEKDFRVVGEAFDGLETVRIVNRINPDVLILDLMMPGMSGLYVTSEVKKQMPQTRVVILSMHADDKYVQEALRRGADGYVLKDMIAEEIVQAVRSALSGRRYVGDFLLDSRSSYLTGRSSSDSGEPYDTLTVREREVFYMVAQGRKNREIAELLGISIRTAETHRARIMRKLQLRNHAHLVCFAVQKKIISST